MESDATDFRPDTDRVLVAQDRIRKLFGLDKAAAASALAALDRVLAGTSPNEAFAFNRFGPRTQEALITICREEILPPPKSPALLRWVLLCVGLAVVAGVIFLTLAGLW